MPRRHPVEVEERGRAAVAWARGVSHDRYEDRYRLLTDAVPLVARLGRGELVAVFDGVGGLRPGMRSAQAMADGLLGAGFEVTKIPMDLLTPELLRGWLAAVRAAWGERESQS